MNMILVMMSCSGKIRKHFKGEGGGEEVGGGAAELLVVIMLQCDILVEYFGAAGLRDLQYTNTPLLQDPVTDKML